MTTNSHFYLQIYSDPTYVPRRSEKGGEGDDDEEEDEETGENGDGGEDGNAGGGGRGEDGSIGAQGLSRTTLSAALGKTTPIARMLSRGFTPRSSCLFQTDSQPSVATGVGSTVMYGFYLLICDWF